MVVDWGDTAMPSAFQSASARFTIVALGLTLTAAYPAAAQQTQDGALLPVPPVVMSTAPRPLPMDPAASRATIMAPHWTQPPVVEFPELAFTKGIDRGQVELMCSVARDGALKTCQVASEFPLDADFGHAAVEGARMARISRPSGEGFPADASVRFLIRFRLPDPEPTEAPPASAR